MTTVKRNAGFTLVELAIVLVIIGLLVGGVLVGQDLIKAAEIRAVSSDLQKYDTGAAAFRTKYTGIPGDLINTRCTNFFATPAVCGAGTDGAGDGDGMLENGATPANKQGLGGENLWFWRQMSEAQFIPFGSTSDGTQLATVTAATKDPVMPKVRIRDITYVHATGIAGLNYYLLGNIAGTGAVPTVAAGLSPREALGVDEKIDDGNASRGVVLAVANTTAVAVSAASAAAGGADAATMAALVNTACFNTGTTTASLAGNYNTSTEDKANSLLCALRIRAQF